MIVLKDICQWHCGSLCMFNVQVSCETKPVRKTDTLLPIVWAKKHCDLTLLCFHNRHFFLQHCASIIFPASGGKTDWLGHFQPEIYIESHSDVNLCPVLYLIAYLRHTEVLGWSQMNLWCLLCVLVNIGSTCQYVRNQTEKHIKWPRFKPEICIPDDHLNY